MLSHANQFKVGDEIYLIKYKGNYLITDYSKSYFITHIEKEQNDKNNAITRLATLDNGSIQLLYAYSLHSFSNEGITYYAEKKQPTICESFCFCTF